LDRRLEDVAQRGAAIGGAVLRHGLFLLGDLQGLDGDRDAPAVLVDVDDRRIDLVADVETLWTLLGAIARQVRALDEGRHVAVGDFDLDAAILYGHHLAGDLAALLQFANALHGIATDLLDAQADAFLLRINVKHYRFDGVALLVVLDGLVAGTVPIQI